MVKVELEGLMAFRAESSTGLSFVMDASADVGGAGLGVSPVEALLASAAACSGMDVMSILRKKKQVVTSYRLEVDGERAHEGEWPRPFSSITINHILTGENLDPAAVARAVELSDEKYCTVVATLRVSPKIVTNWQVL